MPKEVVAQGVLPCRISSHRCRLPKGRIGLVSAMQRKQSVELGRWQPQSRRTS